MAIDFLGHEPKRGPVKKTGPVRWHKPIEEKEVKEIKAKQSKPVQVKKVEPVRPANNLEEVNLVPGFKHWLWKKRLSLLLIFAIMIVAVGSLAIYFGYYYQPPKVVVKSSVISPSPSPKPTPTPTPTPTPSPAVSPGPIITPTPIMTPSPSPSPIFEPSPTPISSPSPLPDTELSPLRGSLVKFKDSLIIYLVENNGELRMVNQETIFANGQSLSQISSLLIYTIADRFKDVRRGKAVSGKVNWDPRILSQLELNPYIY
jgi:hypothetical protein